MPARADPNIDAAVLLERRRAQNRLAQHRFRQRKLAAAKAAGNTVQPKKAATERDSQEPRRKTTPVSPSDYELQTIQDLRPTRIKIEEFESSGSVDLHPSTSTTKSENSSTVTTSKSFLDMLSDFGDPISTSLPPDNDFYGGLFASSSSCSPPSTSSPADGAWHSSCSSASSPSSLALGYSFDSAFNPPPAVSTAAVASTAPALPKNAMTQTCSDIPPLAPSDTIPYLDGSAIRFYGALGLTTIPSPCATASSADSAGSAATVYPLWMDSCSR